MPKAQPKAETDMYVVRCTNGHETKYIPKMDKSGQPILDKKILCVQQIEGKNCGAVAEIVQMPTNGGKATTEKKPAPTEAVKPEKPAEATKPVKEPKAPVTDIPTVDEHFGKITENKILTLAKSLRETLNKQEKLTEGSNGSYITYKNESGRIVVLSTLKKGLDVIVKTDIEKIPKTTVKELGIETCWGGSWIRIRTTVDTKIKDVQEILKKVF